MLQLVCRLLSRYKFIAQLQNCEKVAQSICTSSVFAGLAGALECLDSAARCASVVTVNGDSSRAGEAI